ncbi:MAG: hypothetical protein JWO30_2721 [Fibrobacteres bacterium]|nr:hypothetical protein [Fibrobacterota bacterium]
MNKPRASVFVNGIAALWALVLFACLPMGDRVAGSSTEAGNAGGKLSMADGKPAAGVSVALVARSYLPDTLDDGSAKGDVAGSYYRTRTGTDGRYQFSEVTPGDYRVVAIGQGTGCMADSVSIAAGGDTALIDRVLKPLGGIRGIAKVVGSKENVNVWVRPKATLKTPPRADLANGGFALDSLPEGEYELVPLCFSCQPLKDGYRVKVTAGKDTVLPDTLKVYPEYFYDFPDSGDLDVRTAWLPLRIGGKINRGAAGEGMPVTIAWDWNGSSLAGTDIARPEGVSETSMLLDSSMFAGLAEGTLRVTVAFPDTTIVREWHVRLDSENRIWPLSAVGVDSMVKVSGPLPHMWRFRVAGSRLLDLADVAFWGVNAGVEANQTALPGWLYLAVDNVVEKQLESGSQGGLTFILVPDGMLGGRVVRPRWNERLADFREIRYLDLAQLGFAETPEPSMLPGGLVVDRERGFLIHQRYRIDSSGRVEELLGALPILDPKPGTAMPAEPPILFYRSGAAADGFSWDKPLRDAAKSLAVTREGYAVRLDGSGIAVNLTAGQLDSLKALLAPLAQDPSSMADTAGIPETGNLEYVWGGKRGLLRASGSGTSADTLLSALRDWIVRNGLEETPRFDLSGPEWRFLAFESDSSGTRYTGDTLVLEIADTGSGASVREFLAPGSPSRANDSAVLEYGLMVARDSLVGVGAALPVNSRLFGKINGAPGIFPLTGLKPIAPEFRNGLPILTGNGNTLAGRLETSVDVHGRSVAAPRVWLDGRGIGGQSKQGLGFLYTPESGLEKAWRFNGSDGSVKGWDRN